MWLHTDNSLNNILWTFHKKIPLTEHPPYEKAAALRSEDTATSF